MREALRLPFGWISYFSVYFMAFLKNQFRIQRNDELLSVPLR